MTSGQKIAFSLLTTVVLFAGFIVCAHGGVLDNLETRYYSQTVIRQKTEQLDLISEGLDSYIQKILNRVEQNEDSYLKSSSVASYIDQNPSESQIVQRKKQTEQLFVDLPDLAGIRIIDKNGKNVHYSTYDDTDLLKITGLTKVYKYYSDIKKDGDELDFSVIAVPENDKKHKLFIDDEKNRLVISFPFYWFNNIYAGTFVFYFNLADVEKSLVNQKVFAFGESIVAFSQEKAEGGFVIGVPVKNEADFKNPVQKSWKNGATVEPEKILSLDDGRFWMLITSGKSDFLKVSGVYTSDVFQLADEIIYLIYGSVGITLFLIAFLIFSFATPKDVAIKRKIKRIQYGILKEYIDNKEKIEWSKAVNQLKGRQKELSEEILKDAGVHSKRKRKQMDEFLDKTWEEIFNALDSSSESAKKDYNSGFVPSQTVSGISLDELRRVLREVLKENQPVVKVVNQSAKSVPLEEVEEIEEVESADDEEEIAEVESVEEIEDIAEIESIDEAEEIEEVESADEVEDIEEVESADDVEEIAEVEPAEEIEDIAEIESIDEAEEIEDAESAEEPDVIEEVESADDVEEIAEVESVEEIEDIAEIESLDESEEIETAENDVEEFDVLEEIVVEEYVPAKNKGEPDFSAFIPPEPREYSYVENNETFIDNTKCFATVDNLFAEVLSLGDAYIQPSVAGTPLDFTIYQLNEEELKSEPEVVENIDSVEEVEELSEEIGDNNKYFSMIRFGENSAPVKDLEGDSKETIAENNGVFSITENIDTSKVSLDLDFKNLVDSVLKNKE